MHVNASSVFLSSGLCEFETGLLGNKILDVVIKQSFEFVQTLYIPFSGMEI